MSLFAEGAQVTNATRFVVQVGLRDPRQYSAFFLTKQFPVWAAILSWGPIPSFDDNLGFNELVIYTDGSAVIGGRWPRHIYSAGWGMLALAKTSDQTRFLGALWGPVATSGDEALFSVPREQQVLLRSSRQSQSH